MSAAWAAARAANGTDDDEGGEKDKFGEMLEARGSRRGRSERSRATRRRRRRPSLPPESRGRASPRSRSGQWLLVLKLCGNQRVDGVGRLRFDVRTGLKATRPSGRSATSIRGTRRRRWNWARPSRGTTRLLGNPASCGSDLELSWTSLVANCCVEIKILRRVRAESSRRPPRHRRDACSMAWRCVPRRSTEPERPRHRREMTW